MKFNGELGNRLVFNLQKHIRIMPCTLVATILLLFRKGINEAELVQKVKWLGMALIQRGIKVADDTGIPSATITNIGLKQLEGQYTRKRDFIVPKIVVGDSQVNDYSNIILLAYYRNALNYVFYNESIIACSLFSFGVEEIWKNGVTPKELFKRACYLEELIKREEVIQSRIVPKHRQFFDKVIDFMISQRLLRYNTNAFGEKRLFPKTSGETSLLLIGSIVWPMIDTYYTAAITALTMVKTKDLSEAMFMKNCQFLGETLHSEGKT